MNAEPQSPSLDARPHAIERSVLAVLSAVLVHLVILGGGGIATAFAAARGKTDALPEEPLLVLAVALLMAHCSLGAIWWARTSWPPSARTITAAASCAGLWLLLISLLSSTRTSGVAAAAWASCFISQAVLTATAATAIELRLDYRATAARNRISILFLLTSTTIVAAALAWAGAKAAHGGWKIADVPHWEFFWQLQVLALVNAALGVAVFSSVRLPRALSIRALACASAVVAFAAATPAVFLTIFREKVGPSPTDLVWLFGGEGLFLVAALVPLETVRELPHIAK